MGRWLLPFVGMMLCFGGGLAVCMHFWSRPQPRVNEDTYGQLKVGMTLQEVEELFGAPPGVYGSGYLKIMIESASFDDREKEWIADEWGIWVAFDDERASHWRIAPVFRESTSPMDTIERHWRYRGRLVEIVPGAGKLSWMYVN